MRYTPLPRDERGQVLIVTALTLTTLLAIAALAIDTAFMYDKRNHLAAAADASVVASSAKGDDTNSTS